MLSRSVRVIRTVLGVVAFALAVPSAPAFAASRVTEIVVNAADGKVLYARDADKLRRPASLTKMMTLYLAFDALDEGRLRLSDQITISRHAARQPPSHLGIAAGQTISVRSALQAIAVVSTNDVAVALAERLGGSEADFARSMTDKAQRLGMRDTRFANVSGLTDAGNVTTARDMATLSRALLQHHADRYSYFGTRSITWRSHRLFNHNHLLGKVPGVDGIKTGYTVDAGFNLAASAKRQGTRIVVVVLDEHSVAARDARVANLIEQGFTALGVVGRPSRHGAAAKHTRARHGHRRAR